MFLKANDYIQVSHVLFLKIIHGTYLIKAVFLTLFTLFIKLSQTPLFQRAFSSPIVVLSSFGFSLCMKFTLPDKESFFQHVFFLSIQCPPFMPVFLTVFVISTEGERRRQEKERQTTVPLLVQDYAFHAFFYPC